MSDGTRPKRPAKRGRAKTKTPEEEGRDYAKSLRELGRCLNRTHQSLGLWLKRADWPFGHKPGARWNIAGIRHWAALNVGDDPAKMGPQPDDPQTKKLVGEKHAASLDLTQERAAKLRQERLEREKKLIPSDEVEYANVQKIHMVRTALMGLPRNLEAELVFLRKKDKKRIGSILEELIVEVLKEFAGDNGRENKGKDKGKGKKETA